MELFCNYLETMEASRLRKKSLFFHSFKGVIGFGMFWEIVDNYSVMEGKRNGEWTASSRLLYDGVGWKVYGWPLYGWVNSI